MTCEKCSAEIPPLQLLLQEVVPLVDDHADLMWDHGFDEVARKWWDWLKRVEAALAQTPATPTPGDEEKGGT